MSLCDQDEFDSITVNGHLTHETYLNLRMVKGHPIQEIYLNQHTVRGHQIHEIYLRPLMEKELPTREICLPQHMLRRDRLVHEIYLPQHMHRRDHRVLEIYLQQHMVKEPLTHGTCLHRYTATIPRKFR